MSLKKGWLDLLIKVAPLLVATFAFIGLLLSVHNYIHDREKEKDSANLTNKPLSNEEKLAGEYELIRVEQNEGGVITGYESPVVEGSMILIHEGPVYTSFTDVDGYEENQKSDAWTATATTLIYDEWRLSYTLEADILTLTEGDDDFIQTYTFKKVS